jgi:hypothetical protein
MRSIKIDGTLQEHEKIVSDNLDTSLVVFKQDIFTAIAVFTPRTPRQGETVSIWGNPGPMRNQFRRGTVSGRHKTQSIDGLPRVYNTFDMPSASGDSGAGIFDHKGNVIGVLLGHLMSPMEVFQSTLSLTPVFTPAQLQEIK